MDEINRTSEVGLLSSDAEQAVQQITLVDKFPIAGFFRRVLAVIIDVLIVGIPLLIFFTVFKNIGIALGPYGRIVGYTAMTIYWTIYHSHLHDGQSLGKKLLKIAVVDSQGKFLDLRRSFLRTFVLAVISILNGWAIPILQNPIVAFFATIIVFGGGLSLFYGLVFNRTTRQGIHDLILGTYVIHQAPPITNISPPELPKIHKRITYGIIGLAILMAVTGLIFQFIPIGNNRENNVELGQIQHLQTLLEQREDVLTANVSRINRTSLSSGNVLKDLRIEVWINTPCQNNFEYCDQLMKEIAQMVFAEYENVNALDGMKISIVNQIDLGFISSSNVQGAELRMEDWKKQINE
jgi:uncharacterized RDD family membrane protein YckC